MAAPVFGRADIFKLYEDGKHRRYSLLFSVNGGAFAIAQLFNTQASREYLGQLSLSSIGYGLAVYTVIMGIDIFAFGDRMGRAFDVCSPGPAAVDGLRPFGCIGKVVLVLICLLIAVGWLLVAVGRSASP